MARRFDWVTCRILLTPAPTQGYHGVLDTYGPYPHCTPGFEEALVLCPLPGRFLHVLLCAFAQRQEPVHGVYSFPGTNSLYIRTAKTLYLGTWAYFKHGAGVRLLVSRVR